MILELYDFLLIFILALSLLYLNTDLLPTILIYFISKIFIISLEKNELSFISNIFFGSGLVVCLSTCLGLLELIFFETSFFYITLSNYPYSLSEKYLITGFFSTQNSLTYYLIFSMGFFNYQNIIDEKLKPIVLSFFIVSFLIASAKSGVLFLAILTILFLSKSFHQKTRYILIVILILVYMIFSNFLIYGPNYLFESSHHFRKLLLQNEYFSLILGFYGHDKLMLVNNINIFPAGLNLFMQEYNFLPHGLITDSLVRGGLVFTIVIISVIYRNVREINLERLIKEDIFLYSSMITLLIELLNWNLTDSIIFWILVLLSPKIIKPVE